MDTPTRPIKAYLLEVLQVPEFVRLENARKAGWEITQLDRDYTERRTLGRTQDFKHQKNGFFSTTYTVMEEIDQKTELLSSIPVERFLDIGACPGSFSAYVLGHLYRSIGFGISLPSDEGGHELALQGKLQRRYTLFYQDITRTTLPLESLQSMDLVIGDAHLLREPSGAIKVSAEPTKGYHYDILYYSQVIMALQAVRTGGNLLLKSQKVEWISVMRNLEEMESVCERLECYKPEKCWSKNSSFYIICYGVKTASAAYTALLIKYNALLKRLHEIRAEDGQGIFDAHEDEDEMIRTGLIDRMIPIVKNVWAVQAAALEKNNAKANNELYQPW